MKRWMLPFAIVGIMGLTACPEEESVEDTDAGQTVADAGDTCDRPGGAPRGMPCTDSEDCQCGLDCLRMSGASGGICMDRCISDDDCETATPACGLGELAEMQRQLGTPTFTETMCLGELGQYDDCYTLTSVCGEGTSCWPSTDDDATDDGIPDFMNCQEDCFYGADNATCTDSSQECIPNIPGYIFPQANPPDSNNYVTCSEGDCEPGAPCPCDTAQGNSCGELFFTDGSTAFLCYRVPGICGQFVPFTTYDAWSSEDTDIMQYVCDGEQGLGCDPTLGGLEDPPYVDCWTGLFGDQAPTWGLCMTFCSGPADDYLSQEPWGECPANHICVADENTYPTPINLGTGDADEYVPCAQDTDCAAYPGGMCIEYNPPLGNLCSMPLGMCRDESMIPDAGMPDSAVEDAAKEDGGEEDAGSPPVDAGVAEDATATPDAATMPDTYTPPEDAGAPEDMGTSEDV